MGAAGLDENQEVEERNSTDVIPERPMGDAWVILVQRGSPFQDGTSASLLQPAALEV